MCGNPPTMVDEFIYVRAYYFGLITINTLVVEENDVICDFSFYWG